MMTLWIMSALIISALLGSAALASERVMRLHGYPSRWVWTAAMVASCVLPLALPYLRAVVPVSSGAPDAAAVRWEIGVPRVVAAELPPKVKALDAPLRIAWGMGSVGVLGFLGVSLLQMRRRRREWQPAEVDGIAVLISRSTGPAVVGFRQAEIVLPSWILTLTPAARRLSLEHEAEHVRAGDNRLLLVSFLGLAAMPWNPLLWWQFHHLRLAVEIDCDARVLRGNPDVKAYASTLLEAGRRSSPAPFALAAFSEPVTSLERRLRAMTAASPRHARIRTLAYSALAVGAMLAACAAPTPPEPAADAGSASTGPADSPGQTAVPADLGSEPSFTPRTVEPELPAEQRQILVRYLDDHYPADLREAGTGGRVLLGAFIDQHGVTGNTRVVESSGYPAFDRLAQAALHQIRWTPARLHDQPAPVWIQLPIVFQLGP